MSELHDAARRLLTARMHTTPGVWRKGLTTHHTVSDLPQGGQPYRIAEFHHADDAHFLDVAHEVAVDLANAVLATEPKPDCGACPGDGTICPEKCRLAEESPPVPVTSTPSSRWKADGEPDPHGTRYDCERAALALGKLTDDELANGAFLNYDHFDLQRTIAQDPDYHPPIVWMTAVKDRIRWLSRRLADFEPVGNFINSSPADQMGAWGQVAHEYRNDSDVVVLYRIRPGAPKHEPQTIVERPRSAGKASEDDTERMNWYAQNPHRVVSLAGRWYSTKGHRQPVRRHESLREAIDHARSGQ